MRTFSSSIMALLIVVALFWGNCYSCPQVLLAQSDDCCHPTKTPRASCASQGLQSFVKADAPASAAPVVAALPIPPLAYTAPVNPAPVPVNPEPASPAPLSLRI